VADGRERAAMADNQGVIKHSASEKILRKKCAIKIHAVGGQCRRKKERMERRKNSWAITFKGGSASKLKRKQRDQREK